MGTTVNLMGGLTIQGHAGIFNLVGTPQGDRIISSERSEILQDGGGGNDTYVFSVPSGRTQSMTAAGRTRFS